MVNYYRAFSPAQYIRIFTIVSITSFVTTRAILNDNTMGGKKNAQKEEAAARKQAEKSAQSAAAEEEKWQQGAKSDNKKADAAAKKAEQAAKKAERDRQLAEEEASQRSTPKGANKKTAEKKSKGLDLSQLDGEPSASSKAQTLNASGIDNALDALSLTADSNEIKLERHPERRFKAAYAKYEAEALPRIKAENPGLRKNQMEQLARKEFEKHPDNPFNQVGNVRYDATKDELSEQKKNIRDAVENRLGEK